MFNGSYGAEIDSHDIVIRFNKGFIYYLNSQGKRTDILFLACLLRDDEREGYVAKYIINRSKNYRNPANFTMSNKDRERLKNILGAQPSTGFMAIDLCLEARAEQIDLYGFDFEATPTFYNEGDYKTQHNYSKEQEIVLEYQQKGLLTIHTSPTPPFSTG
ncbi:MAG: glycosyltransferase family 29 protein [Lachnospiraceae bacterium]|nr:glycosyltransferase family 29 protein [Lachnospiraceae bacterium]